MAKKSEEAKEPEKIYPSIILGLDISTACIGISIVIDRKDEEPEIVEIRHLVPKIPNKIKGIEALILRKDIFEKDFLTKYKNFGITECVVESPITHTSSQSSANTVAQLIKFNALLCEAVYRVLGIIPHDITSYEARMYSFPELMSLRKFNRKGKIYDLAHYKKALKDEHLVLFGDFPFDCDKKSIMMNMVCEKYPDIKWVYNAKGDLKKENYDACDALVCALGYINQKRYGEMTSEIVESNITDNTITYTSKIWDKEYIKKLVF